MLVQHGVEEADGALADGLALRVDESDDGGPQRGGEAGAVALKEFAADEDGEGSAVSADVGVAAAGAVVDASAAGADVGGVGVGLVGTGGRGRGLAK